MVVAFAATPAVAKLGGSREEMPSQSDDTFLPEFAETGRTLRETRKSSAWKTTRDVQGSITLRLDSTSSIRTRPREAPGQDRRSRNRSAPHTPYHKNRRHE